MYREAINRDPNFALACARLSVVHSTLFRYRWQKQPQNHLDSARIFLEKAEAIDPNLTEVHNARGLFLFYVIMDLDGGLLEFEKALEVEPSNVEALVRIGQIWQLKNDFVKADSYLEQGYELEPNGILTTDLLGYLYRLQRRWDEAEMVLNKHIVSFPEEVQGHIQKARIYLSGYGDPKRARSILEETLQHVPEPSNWLTTTRWQVEIYSRDYEQALAALGNQADMHLLRAMTYRFMGRNEEAKAHFDSARVDAEQQIRRWPNTTGHFWNLGYANAGLGRNADAVLYGRQRVDNPVNLTLQGEWSLWHLARIYIMAGEYDKAINELENLLSIPSPLTRWDLRLDPMYDPLRDHPRFKKLVGAAE
jgi:serine/threonine-protein kinase